MASFSVNGESVTVDVPDSTPLLWVLREELKLLGTKFGCGKGVCGACTIHLNGTATRCCILPVSAVEGQEITTIEGLGTKESLHIVQRAWIKHNVAQCGYCQSGQIMQASSLIDNNSDLELDSLVGGMSANLCRCGTYHKLKDALLEAAQEKQNTK